MASVVGNRAPTGIPVPAKPSRTPQKFPKEAIKLSIRLLPPRLTEASFLLQLGAHTPQVAASSIQAFYYVQGSYSTKPFEEPVYSRAYLQVGHEGIYNQLLRDLKDKSFVEPETEDSLVPVVSKALFHPMPKKEKGSKSRNPKNGPVKAAEVSASPEPTTETKTEELVANPELLELEKSFLFRKFVEFYNGNVDTFHLVEPQSAKKAMKKATKNAAKKVEKKSAKDKKRGKTPEAVEPQDASEKPRKKKSRRSKEKQDVSSKPEVKLGESDVEKSKKDGKKRGKKGQSKAAKGDVEKVSKAQMAPSTTEKNTKNGLEKAPKVTGEKSQKTTLEKPTEPNDQKEATATSNTKKDGQESEEAPKIKKKPKKRKSKKPKENGPEKAGNGAEKTTILQKAVNGSQKGVNGPAKKESTKETAKEPKDNIKDNSENKEGNKPKSKDILKRKNEAPPQQKPE